MLTNLLKLSETLTGTLNLEGTAFVTFTVTYSEKPLIKDVAGNLTSISNVTTTGANLTGTANANYEVHVFEYVYDFSTFS